MSRFTSQKVGAVFALIISLNLVGCHASRDKIAGSPLVPAPDDKIEETQSSFSPGKNSPDTPATAKVENATSDTKVISPSASPGPQVPMEKKPEPPLNEANPQQPGQVPPPTQSTVKKTETSQPSTPQGPPQDSQNKEATKNEGQRLESGENTAVDTSKTVDALEERIVKQGVPLAALSRVLNFLDLVKDRKFYVKGNSGQLQVAQINNKDYVAIIDYSLPSSQRRFFLIHLPTANVKRFYVAHGVNTGGDIAEKFSNVLGSKQTSLGIYLTGEEFISSKGPSLALYGLEKSNDRAYEREIIMHGARYVSMDFLQKYNRMGRSWGCPALSQEITRSLIPLIKNGTLVYAFHRNLMSMAATSPTVQIVSRNQERGAGQGDEIVPEEVDP